MSESQFPKMLRLSYPADHDLVLFSEYDQGRTCIELKVCKKGLELADRCAH